MSDAIIGRLLLNDGQELVFHSPEEVAAFVKQQLDFVARCEGHQPSLSPLKAHLKLLWKRSNESFSSPEQWSAFAATAHKAFERFFALSSVKGQFVSGLMSRSEAEAAACLAYACGLPVRLESDESRLGAMRGLLLESGVMAPGVLDPALNKMLAAKAQQWDELHARASQGVKEAAARVDDISGVVARLQASCAADTELLKGDVALARGETHQVREESRAGLAALESGSKARLQSLVDETKAALQAFEEGVKSKIALQAPVSYWRKRASEHKVRSRWFALAFAAWLVVSLGAFYCVLGPGSDFKFLPLEADWAKLPVARLVALGLMVTLSVWVARTLLRLLFSHLHLLNDAKERETMVQTYLALLAEGSGLSDGDRRGVIDALFRRAGSGFSKDDANPPNLLGIATKSP